MRDVFCRESPHLVLLEELVKEAEPEVLVAGVILLAFDAQINHLLQFGGEFLVFII